MFITTVYPTVFVNVSKLDVYFNYLSYCIFAGNLETLINKNYLSLFGNCSEWNRCRKMKNSVELLGMHSTYIYFREKIWKCSSWSRVKYNKIWRIYCFIVYGDFLSMNFSFRGYIQFMNKMNDDCTSKAVVFSVSQ